MEIKAFYRCPVCGKEYTSDKDAIACANKPQKKHKYKIGSVVSIKTNKYCSPYTSIIIETTGHEGHEPKYIVDPKNGLCTYDIVESQIVKEVLSLEVLNKRESALDALIDEFRCRVRDLFGMDCTIDDESYVAWDDKKVANVKFCIKK